MPVPEPELPSLPEVALRPALERLVEDLESHGVDSSRLRALQGEVQELEHPPGFFARMKRTVRDTVQRNWSHLVGEMEETARLVGMVRRSVSGGRVELTAEERAEARSQMADLMRVAPAAVVFLALELFPIPGTGILTPWLLLRMGLMPSRWREAHVLHGLRTEAAELRRSAHAEEAAAVERLVDAVEAGCKRRERSAHEAALLTHWDFDGNGRWDPDERTAYEGALEALARVARARAAERIWVLRHSSYVFGPFRLSEVMDVDTDVDLLVCTGADTPWVDLAHLLERVTAAPERESSPVPAPADR
jgi:hypothetical protein